MSATNDATDSTADEQTDDDEDFEWIVEEDEIHLARDGYDYVLGHGAVRITFDGVRDPDAKYNDGRPGEYELRDDHDVMGYFDPTDESVPDAVATAFRVLAGEL